MSVHLVLALSVLCARDGRDQQRVHGPTAALLDKPGGGTTITHGLADIGNALTDGMSRMQESVGEAKAAVDPEVECACSWRAKFACPLDIFLFSFFLSSVFL